MQHRSAPVEKETTARPRVAATRAHLKRNGMTSCIVVALLMLQLAASMAEARRITDSAGRTVEIPDRVERVFAAGPPASILLYMLAPEKMSGWPDPPAAVERPFIAPAYRDLPPLGRLTGRGGTANLEVVLRTKPDLILDFGSTRATYVSLADNVQEQTRLPYILIDGRLETTPAALRLLGDVLNRKERGERLAKYVEATLAEIDEALTNGRQSISHAEETGWRRASSAPSTPRSSSGRAVATWWPLRRNEVWSESPWSS
jgi:ABC-type Fe3+-hydroxamate transport system substrate-binding protein